ncbi:MAG: PilZ domain-containing protein [Halioglobus sp.]|nr:PilZ domain-containing protein [Halioglobus sp.]
MSDNESNDSAAMAARDNGAPGGTGLSFTDNFSIEWRPVEYSPDDEHLALVNQSNEAFLRAVAALAAFSGEHSEEEGAISQEIERLDRKVNLVLDLVSQLVYKQLDLPDKTRVTISATDMLWREDNPPAPGEKVFVQAYVQHGTPKPLCFYGEVTSTQQDRDAGCCRVSYVGLSQSLQSWLDKLIFRHHRREVAFKRAKTS